jgi:hypothetical protein
MKAELFDRYVHEVGRRLPRKQRADVEAELRSLLMDALQDRASEADVPEGEAAADAASEADQVAVLEEFGPPAQVAAQYTPPHRYLIGPRLYDIYWIVVAAVAGSLTLAHLVMLIVALWGQAVPFGALGPAFGEVFGGYLGALLTGFGSITLTFALLERVLPESALAELGQEKEWDPRSLPRIEDRGRLELGGVIAETVVTVVALILFNVFPEWIGVNFRGSIDGASAVWHSTPMLSAAFFTLYLPWLNALWVARIALNVVLLRMGRWQRLTRLVDLALTAFGGYILYRMIAGPSLLTLEALRPESLRETMESILLPMLQVALIIGLLATAGEAVRKLIRVFRAETVSVDGRPADSSANR